MRFRLLEIDLHYTFQFISDRNILCFNVENMNADIESKEAEHI